MFDISIIIDIMMMPGSKGCFDPMIHRLLRISCSRNPANIRNPLIYYVNRYFSVFYGAQVQKPYHASMNGFLTF